MDTQTRKLENFRQIASTRLLSNDALQSQGTTLHDKNNNSHELSLVFI